MSVVGGIPQTDMRRTPAVKPKPRKSVSVVGGIVQPSKKKLRIDEPLTSSKTTTREPPKKAKGFNVAGRDSPFLYSPKLFGD